MVRLRDDVKPLEFFFKTLILGITMVSVELTEEAQDILEEQKCEEAPTYSDVIVGMWILIDQLTARMKDGT